MIGVIKLSLIQLSIKFDFHNCNLCTNLMKVLSLWSPNVHLSGQFYAVKWHWLVEKPLLCANLWQKECKTDWKLCNCTVNTIKYYPRCILTFLSFYCLLFSLTRPFQYFLIAFDTFTTAFKILQKKNYIFKQIWK